MIDWFLDFVGACVPIIVDREDCPPIGVGFGPTLGVALVVAIILALVHHFAASTRESSDTRSKEVFWGTITAIMNLWIFVLVVITLIHRPNPPMSDLFASTLAAGAVSQFMHGSRQVRKNMKALWVARRGK